MTVTPLAILGGTFDPIHYGHLRLALECHERLALNRVHLIPLHTPPHRHIPVAEPAHRLEMLRLAVANHAALIADDREIQRGGVSYTVDTLRSFREQINSQPLCTIMGLDAFTTLDSWHDWQLILEYSHIIVVNRPGSPVNVKSEEIAHLFEKKSVTDASVLHQQPAGAILKIDIPMLDISATRIRQLVNKNKDTHFLLPEPVINYIEQHNLYKTA